MITTNLTNMNHKTSLSRRFKAWFISVLELEAIMFHYYQIPLKKRLILDPIFAALLSMICVLGLLGVLLTIALFANT